MDVALETLLVREYEEQHHQHSSAEPGTSNMCDAPFTSRPPLQPQPPQQQPSQCHPRHSVFGVLRTNETSFVHGALRPEAAAALAATAEKEPLPQMYQFIDMYKV